MLRMAVGHSDDVDLDTAVQAVLEQCEKGLLGFQEDSITLAMFASDRVDITVGIERWRGRT